MQINTKQSLLIFWSTAILVFFISLTRVYDIALDRITPYSSYSPFIPWVVIPAYIYCFIRARKESHRAQLVLLNFLFFYIYLSFLNIIGCIYTETRTGTDILRISYRWMEFLLLLKWRNRGQIFC